MENNGGSGPSTSAGEGAPVLHPDNRVAGRRKVAALGMLSHVQFFATLWTVAHQAPVSMGFCRHQKVLCLTCPLPPYRLGFPDPRRVRTWLRDSVSRFFSPPVGSRVYLLGHFRVSIQPPVLGIPEHTPGPPLGDRTPNPRLQVPHSEFRPYKCYLTGDPPSLLPRRAPQD